MIIYFLLILIFFLMLYNIILGVFKIITENFWGYYEKIIKRINKYSRDDSIYGQEEVILKSLEKQKKELEDIMGQYVFFRFCERISNYFTQISMILNFCISIAAVFYIHSAILNNEIILAFLCFISYLVYIWYESTGEFIKFEIWATNLFFKQYKILTESGLIERIIETKKHNKKVLIKFYIFFILPFSLLIYILLNNYIFYPLLPKIPFELEKSIFINWLYFIISGFLFVTIIPVILDKFLNSKLKINFFQIKESYYAILIYIFLSFLLAIAIGFGKYII